MHVRWTTPPSATRYLRRMLLFVLLHGSAAARFKGLVHCRLASLEQPKLLVNNSVPGDLDDARNQPRIPTASRSPYAR